MTSQNVRNTIRETVSEKHLYKNYKDKGFFELN